MSLSNGYALTGAKIKVTEEMSKHQLKIIDDNNFCPGKTKNLIQVIDKNGDSTIKTENFI